MSLTIPVAHDFTCPWCWIGFSQAKRLKHEFGVKFDWLGYEQFPEELDFPEASPMADYEPNRPKMPGRLRLAYAAEGLEIPTSTRNARMRTHNAHQAVEHAKGLGVAEQLVERMYIAYWRHGLEINEPEVIRLLAKGLISDEAELLEAIEERRYRDRIVGFDEPAFAAGIYNIPTFFIGGERYAEQPFSVLRGALAAVIEVKEDPAQGIYDTLTWPVAPANRPSAAINMVTTIDGKILSGGRDESVMDLGSKTDHAVLRKLEHWAQAVMIGAGTLRATKGIWYPKHLFRFVISGSGDVDPGSRFFSDEPERAFLVTTESAMAPETIQTLRLGRDSVDLVQLARHLRQELGIEHLLIEGGSELNAQMIALGLVDELFLTIAPKIKLGRATPTYAGGEPLSRKEIQNFRLIEQHRVGDELFLRYRRAVEGV